MELWCTYTVLCITASLLLSAKCFFRCSFIMLFETIGNYTFCGFDIDILSNNFGGLRLMGHVLLLAKRV